MLENFTDEDIQGDLLDTGYLYLDLPDGKRYTIKTCAAGPMASIDRTDYLFKEEGEYSHQYLALKVLLNNEAITYDAIRTSWKYHGVLLGNPKFCEELVHDPGCNCVKCVPEQPKNKRSSVDLEIANIDRAYREARRNQSMIKSIGMPFIDWCRAVIASDQYVILDTETTGFYGEVIDLAIVDSSGKEIYNSLLKPRGLIEKKAEDTHHISKAMTDLAPTIADEWSRICDVVGGRKVITYNAKFDSERIEHSLRAYGINRCSGCRWSYQCAMVGYADFYDAPPKPPHSNAPWQPLSQACYQQGITLPPGLHRAMPDTQATWALICKIAATGENSSRYHWN